MSSLRDDVNSRAYASVARGDLRVCHCDACNAKSEPACSGCRADDVPLNDDGLCAMCRPGEDETCAEYDARRGEGEVRLYSYTGRVVSRDGITTTHLVNGSTAAAALTNLRRLRRGDWRRIEVGTGEGTAFRMLAETSR